MIFLSEILNRIEWEGLQEQYKIENNISADELKGTARSIEVWRDENYKIRAKIKGIFTSEVDDLLDDGVAGERIVPFTIKGSSSYDIELYNLNHCYIGNINSSYKNSEPNEYVNSYEADLLTYEVEKISKSDKEASWLTEWYLNGPRGLFWFSRSTNREFSCEYQRNRAVYSSKVEKFIGSGSGGGSRDYLYIKLDEFAFIIHKVPQNIGPNWSINLGIEYRNEFGKIPEESIREAISEIVSFIFGRNILNIGYSIYDSMGYPIKQVSRNPWNDNVVSISSKTEQSPLKLGHNYESFKTVETVMSTIIKNYLEVREEFH